MIRDTSPTRHFHSDPWDLKTLGSLIAVVWITGCSLADFDSLSRGHGKNSGAAGSSGTSANAGASAVTYGGAVVGGGAAGAAGAGAVGVGAAGKGGTGSGGTGKGGTGIIGAAGADAAGAAGTAGKPAGGASGSGAAGGTSQPTSCPTYNGVGGVVVTPPSNDFESNIDQWSKLSSASGLTRASGDGSACNGTGYLSCYGPARQAGWDGPSITLTPYLTVGHSYVMTLAVRFNKSTAPESEHSIGFTAITVCDGSSTAVYTAFRGVLATSNWARIVTDQPFVVPPAGCKSLDHAAVYLETGDADGARTIDVDDFRLIDITNPASASGGTAGVAGAGNAPASGSAGSAGQGGRGS